MISIALTWSFFIREMVKYIRLNLSYFERSETEMRAKKNVDGELSNRIGDEKLTIEYLHIDRDSRLFTNHMVHGW